MFEFINTPNPNAKKIMLEHSFEIAIYLDEKLVENGDLHDFYFFILVLKVYLVVQDF